MSETLAAPPRTRIHVPAVRVAERVHHDGNMLFWQVRGRCELLVAGEEWSLTATEALWVPAGIRHSLIVAADSVMFPLFFATAEAATTLDAVTRVAVDRDLRMLLQAYLQTEMSILQPGVNIARQILAILERSTEAPLTTPLPESGPARQVAELLRFNPGDDRTLAELAASVHSSVRTLERSFLHQTGMTFRQWRISVRIEAAMLLLRSGATCGAVAHRVGYGDVTAFRRVFSRQRGVTPGAYAARFRED